MRKSVAVMLGLLATALVVAGAMVDPPSKPPMAEIAVPPLPPPPVAIPASLPPPPAEIAPEIAMVAPEIAPPPPEIAPPPVPGSDLPVVAVRPRAVHTVDEDQVAPPRPVTLQSRDGHPVAEKPPLAAPVPPRQAAAVPVPQIKGAARVADVVSLSVIGRSLQLFGVKPPMPGDRCAISSRMAPRNCAEVAQEVLATRLRNNSAVSCRVSPNQNGELTAAVCLDSTGVDLAGFLVGEGFALADSAQGRNYSGAESIARSSHRGLWQYR
jgi:endonuclease YncB( thermonuclease family)